VNEALNTTRARLRAAFEAALEAHAATWTTWPPSLAEASRYVLFGGGKRVRPVLALMAAEAVGGDLAVALPWAKAVEMIHTYSLVHDDLPAMDDDDERRGRPTCHKAFDEATAILAGDALLTEAFRTLSLTPDAHAALRLVGLLGEASGGPGMVGGQVDDIIGISAFDDLMSMQARKTGALIRAAALGGAIAAGAGAEDCDRLAVYGAALGVLFQITDDLLDAEQDAERDGNSVLHHLEDAEVRALRDTYAAQAKAAVSPLGDRAEALVAFVDLITHRTV
jgi:geranylgeranyl diphosphate synthase type II